jgi:hypothetical protein
VRERLTKETQAMTSTRVPPSHLVKQHKLTAAFAILQNYEALLNVNILELN